ncbi:uncharacterized protein LOC118199943 [Stegodyphus dumicola]|uniref:uncharacterized protein LOC118199943 n=1 Tax=Stegodyphus dumicola TaxID=202533 RepID=UPI0015B33613|nr:uncharacterized protein LOC118199943 [Stegodyphus dumicola]
MWSKYITKYFIFLSLWIAVQIANSYQYIRKDFEGIVEIPLLTPGSDTETIPHFIPGSLSGEVTSESTDADIYDQISPSRDTTTPTSRINSIKRTRYLHSSESPSTLEAVLSAPPPFHKSW